MAELGRRWDSLIRSLSGRHGRKESEFCLCEGLRCCSEAISLRPDLLEALILREGFQGVLPASPVEPLVLPASRFEGLRATVASQGVLALFRKPGQPASDAPMKDPFAFVLDRVSDPGNFGTILRTARASGLKEVWYAKGSCDPYSEKTIRSASSAQFALGLRRFESLAELPSLLGALGVRRFFRTAPAGGLSLYSAEGLFERSAIIMGAEANGAAALDASTDLHIPMPGAAESLNVAQAATIILFERVRRDLTRS
jgi:TrmH family RNA methyltransferase